MSITSHSYKSLFNAVITIIFSMILAACSGGESGDTDVSESLNTDETNNDTEEASTFRLAGTAVKGVIENGIVRAYPIENQNGVMRVSSTPRGQAVRTNENGEFRFNIRGNTSKSSFIIEISSDSLTTMKCDVLEGCFSNETGTMVAFGETFNLDSNFSMKGAAINPKGQEINNTIITPLSHLAVARAETQQGGLSNDNLETSYAYIEDATGLSSGALNLATPDLTRLDQYVDLNPDSVKTAILSASFLALSNSSEWDNISDVINQAAQSIATSGSITGASTNDSNEVSLEDIYFHAGELTQGLVSESSDEELNASLSIINNEIQEDYAEVASGGNDTVEPVVITTQPSSLNVDEFSEATFTVVANGGGTLRYQWRKNGVNINAANNATLRFENASSSDAGVYDVVVSNEAGATSSLSAVLNITATEPANSAPIAANDLAETMEDTSVTVQVLENDSDPDGDTLSITGASATNGESSINPDNSIHFIPTGNFNGLAEVQYTVSDGNGGISSATVQINVSEVNDNPVARSDNAITNEDTAINVDVLANDLDIDSGTLSILSANATNGSVVINQSASLIFSPTLNFNGTASITYIVSDGQGGSAQGNATISVNPVNDDPVIENDFAATAEDTAVTINALENDSDVDGDTLSIINATTNNGSVSIQNNGTLLFTPGTGFTGSASVNYIVSDNQGGTDQGTVAITVSNNNDQPIAQDDSATTNEDNAVSVNVLANDSDADGDPLTITNTSATNGSVIDAGNGVLAFTPNANFSGTAIVTYIISDGQGASDQGQLTITVNPVNDQPVAQNDSAATNEDSVAFVNVLQNDSDADGDTLTITGAYPTNGSVNVGDNGIIEFTPNANFSGTAFVNYDISDGNGGTDEGMLTVTVNPINDDPIARNDIASTNEDSSVNINVLANDSDADGNSLIISGASANNGSVSIESNGTLEFTPNTNFNGTASVSYTISDNAGGQANANVSITVNPVNDQPTAGNDSATTDQDTSVTVNAFANDSDIDGDSLTIVAAETSNGSLSINGGEITYTPDSGFSGNDTVSYTISDGQGGSATASISITVNAVVSLASIELSWDIPSQREDGGDLELYDISGYVIAYGASASSLDDEISVSGASNTSQQIDNLSPGTYYFAIATVDSDGTQGNFSSAEAITID